MRPEELAFAKETRSGSSVGRGRRRRVGCPLRLLRGAVRRHHARFMAAAAIACRRAGPRHRVRQRPSAGAARAASPGPVVGIDLSSQMIDVASAAATAEGLTNVSFIRGDAQIFPFEQGSFDVAISRFACDVLRRPARRLHQPWPRPATGRPSGRDVVAGAGGQRVVRPPSFAPSPEGRPAVTPSRGARTVRPCRSRADVGAARRGGIRGHRHRPGRGTDGTSGSDAEEGFGRLSASLGWMMAGLDDSERRQALDDLRTALVAHETADGVALGSSAWLITATASSATGARRGT